MLTPIKAIRRFCIGCMGGQLKEVKFCPAKDCELYPYRMGHRPQKSTAEESPDQRSAEEAEEREA